MTRDFKKVMIGCVSALVLAGAAAGAANASYTGYGNADPGNWDLWTEQRGGTVAASPSASVAHATNASGSCGYLHHKALETGSAHWWHRYNACKMG